MKYCLDANVLMTAWYVTYPPETFPTLYEEMEKKLPGNIIIIKPIFDEIEPISDNNLKKLLKSAKDDERSRKKIKEDFSLRIWIKYKLSIGEIHISDDVKQKSLSLMSKYETSNLSSGAGETDIELISYAHENTFTVVTLESRQKQKPTKQCRYKIPLICEKEGVTCIGFIDLLNKCNIIV